MLKLLEGACQGHSSQTASRRWCHCSTFESPHGRVTNPQQVYCHELGETGLCSPGPGSAALPSCGKRRCGRAGFREKAVLVFRTPRRPWFQIFPTRTLVSESYHAWYIHPVLFGHRALISSKTKCCLRTPAGEDSAKRQRGCGMGGVALAVNPSCSHQRKCF